jgi:hypothetical protein
MEPRSGSAWAFPTWKKWKRKVAGVDASESPEAFAVFAGECMAGLFGTYFTLRWKASLCKPPGVLLADDGVAYDAGRLERELGIAWPVLEEGLRRMIAARLLVEVPLDQLVVPVKSEAVPVKFDEWWNKYPSSRRVNRPLCINSWKLRSLEAIADEVLAGLENHLASEQWAKDGGQYIPNSTTWLNQDRWTQKLAAAGAATGWDANQRQLNQRRGENEYDPEVIVKVPDEIFQGGAN